MPRLPTVQREVGVLAGIAFSIALGFGVVAPAIPLLARSFGVSTFAASAVVSVFAFMRLVSALGGGRLVNRYGERRILAIGIGVVAVSSAMAGLAPSYGWLLALRGVGGVGSAMFSISAMSLLLRSVPPERRASASGTFSGAFLVGGVLGPSVGGFVTDSSPRTPFFVYAGTLVVAGSIGLALLPRHQREDPAGVTADGAPPPPVQVTTLGEALRQRAYRGALATSAAAAWTSFGLRSSILPLFVTATVASGGLGLQPRHVGLAFTLAAATNIAVLYPAGRYADRRGRRPVALLGLLILGASVVLLGRADSLTTLLVASAVLGPGSAMLQTAPAAIVGDVVHGRGGTAIAAYQMSSDVGTVVGPLVCGLLVDRVSYGAAFGVTACITVLAAAVVAVAPETRPAPAAPADPATDEPVVPPPPEA